MTNERHREPREVIIRTIPFIRGSVNECALWLLRRTEEM